MESVEEKFLDDRLLPSLDLAPRAWLQAFALVSLQAQADHSDSPPAELQADALRYQAEQSIIFVPILHDKRKPNALSSLPTECYSASKPRHQGHTLPLCPVLHRSHGRFCFNQSVALLLIIRTPQRAALVRIHRCLLTLGMIASIAHAAGEGGRLLLTHWQADSGKLLSAVAGCCTAALTVPEILAAASRAVDRWSDEVGAHLLFYWPSPSSLIRLPELV